MDPSALLFALSFINWSLAAINCFLYLNSFVSRIWARTYDRVARLALALFIMFAATLLSRTAFFANVFNLISPDEPIESTYWTRFPIMTLTLIALTLSMQALLDEAGRKYWGRILAAVIASGSVMYFLYPHFLGKD